MAKGRKEVLKPGVTVLQPTITEVNSFTLKKGMVGIVMLNPDGTEKANSYFETNEYTYNKVYKNKPTEYAVKKKAN